MISALLHRGQARAPSWAAGGSRVLVVNAASLFGTTAITSGLGVVYWWLAARSFSPEAIGFASAAVSAMTLVATLSSLGLGTMLMGEIPRRPGSAGRLLRFTLLGAACAAAVLGLVVCGASSYVSAGLEPLSDGTVIVAIFVVGCIATSVGLAADQAMIGFLRGGLQLWRNVVLGLTKLVALAVVAAVAVTTTSGPLLFATWVLGVAISLAVLGRMVLVGGVVIPAGDGARVSPRTIVREVLRHQGLNLGLQLPVLLLPVLVVGFVSTRANASFYLAFTTAALVGALPGAFTNVLYTFGAADPRALSSKIGFTLRVSTASVAAAVAFIAVAAHPILSIFGPEYARTGTSTLRILAAAALPLIVRNHFVAVARITRRLGRATAYIWIGTIMEIAFAVIGVRASGIEGLSLGWLIALCIEAVVMAPWVLSAARSNPSAGGSVPANLPLSGSPGTGEIRPW